MATSYCLIAIIAVVCSIAQAAYVTNEYFTGTSCTGTLQQVTIYPSDKCLAKGSSATQKFTCDTNNNPKVQTCTGTSCASCTTTTPLACTAASGGGSMAFKCYSTFPVYNNGISYVKNGIFSGSPCSFNNLQSFTYFNGQYCSGNDYLTFKCDGTTLRQYECSDPSCVTCATVETTWYRKDVNCFPASSAAANYVNFTC